LCWLFSSCIATTIPVVEIDPQIVGRDLHVHLFGLRQHRDGAGRRVDPPLRFGRRNALNPVPSALVAKFPVHVLARNREYYLAEAAHVRRRRGHDLDLPALLLRVMAVHVEEVGREERRLLASSAGADFHDDVPVGLLVGGGEKAHELPEQLILAAVEVGEFGLGELGHFRVAAFGEFAGVGDGPAGFLEFAVGRDYARERAVFLDELGVTGGIGDHLRVGQLPFDGLVTLFEVCEFFEELLARGLFRIRRRHPLRPS
jgi:hypothetical protein